MPRLQRICFAVGCWLYASPTFASEPTTVPGFVYLSPRPGSALHPRETTLTLRPSERVSRTHPHWMSRVLVSGSRSGAHDGRWLVSDDGETAVFEPAYPFEAGETVTVSVDAVGSFDFRISPKRAPIPPPTLDRIRCWEPGNDRDGPMTLGPSHEPIDTRAYPLPSDFPRLEVTHHEDPESGRLFLSNFAFSDTINTVSYLMILDDDGAPVFFRRMSNATVDFKKQPSGLLTYYLLGAEKFHALDSTYAVVDSFAAGNGYIADFHDLQLLPNGHALLMIYDPQPVDMSAVVTGGDPNATVVGLVIQELDASKNVVFQWRSWDHFEITDATVDLTGSEVDYVHGNAIELDTDGNILLSSRHLDEITKIDRATGDIIWRMGGRRNEFTLSNDTQWFSRQHDIRRQGNGNITLFDNGNAVFESRAIEYALDEVGKVVTRVWQYRNSPAVWGYAMGSVQRLTGGNTLIGWGSANPTISEVRPDGTRSFELTLAPGIYSYRAYRFPWSGTAPAPTLWADTTGQVVTLGFDKFGDANVQMYYVYGGESPNPMTRVDSTTGHALIPAGLQSGVTYYFRVTAVDLSMNESPFSNQVSVTLDAQTPVLFTQLEASNDGSDVVLTWSINHVSGVQGFNVYRAAGVGDYRRSNSSAIVTSQHTWVDRNLLPGEYRYMVGAIVSDEEILSQPVPVAVTTSGVALYQCYPNPFNPMTTITFNLDQGAHVSLAIYDAAGRHVRTLLDETRGAGPHSVTWDGSDAARTQVGSGVYYCKLEGAGRVLTRSVVVVR